MALLKFCQDCSCMLAGAHFTAQSYATLLTKVVVKVAVELQGMPVYRT